MVAEFRERRDLLVSGLAEIGIDCPLPGGAFYVFPDVSDFGGGDGFAERMLSEAMVAATPGSAFGPGGVGNVRISYAASKEGSRKPWAGSPKCWSESSLNSFFVSSHPKIPGYPATIARRRTSMIRAAKRTAL
jgi:hypothetical protein